MVMILFFSGLVNLDIMHYACIFKKRLERGTNHILQKLKFFLCFE
jgi:hypothetical protein